MPYIETLPASSSLHSVVQYLPKSVPSPLLEMFHSHGPSALEQGHGHEHAHGAIGGDHEHGHGSPLLNPHAAWFALGSVIIKEWLYRLTNRVASEEHSPVLRANALQYVPDPLSSIADNKAIAPTRLHPAWPLAASWARVLGAGHSSIPLAGSRSV